MTTMEMVPARESANVPAVPVVATAGVNAGLLALAKMSEAQFDQTLTLVRVATDRIKRVIDTALTPGLDYDVIPGTGGRRALLQPGAERICSTLQLVPTYEFHRMIGDGVREPVLSYVVRCRLHLGGEGGPLAAEGLAEANSHEVKYRYRKGERLCPTCEKPAIRRSQFPPKGKPNAEKGWYCHSKAGGCGEQFPYADERILGQNIGDVENANPFDLANTLVMMAVKRAYVKATRTASATSDMFTQDIEGGGADVEAGTLVVMVEDLFRANKLQFGDVREMISHAAGKMVVTRRDFQGLDVRALKAVLAAARAKYPDAPAPSKAAPDAAAPADATGESFAKDVSGESFGEDVDPDERGEMP